MSGSRYARQYWGLTTLCTFTAMPTYLIVPSAWTSWELDGGIHRNELYVSAVSPFSC